MSVDRLNLRIDGWKRRLIDLTRRNRLLNYRPTKASTIEIVDEHPHLVLSHLLSGGKFRFDPKPEPGSATSDEVAGVPARRYESGRTLQNGNDQEIAAHHRDDRLQTALLKQRMESNLLAIFRKAEEGVEEQGINTLFLALGMLEWRESDDSDVVSRAPLIMVPVQLRRVDAGNDFVLSMGEEEPILNPAIAEKLRLDFRVTLPELPEFSDDLDVEAMFERIRGVVSGYPRWRITADIALGLFSFQKFIMYRDLEKNADKLRAHRIIRAVCGAGENSTTSSLPSNVANADLDEEASPWASVQVLDADSSQQRAILAVKKGNDLVIEGPPGTGKSQTITNLIADALNDGKRVLFVAEKMAALDVVKTRLEHDAGLGDFVLELHSNKTSKRDFVASLGRALNQHGVTSVQQAAELDQLKSVTNELREYVVALHEPRNPLGLSPFRVIAELAALEDQVRKVDLGLPDAENVSRDALAETCNKLDALAHTLREIGDPLSHPLRGIGLENAGRGDRATLEQAVQAAGSAFTDLTDALHDVAETLGLTPPVTMGDVAVTIAGARTVVRTPGADMGVLESPAWNEMSAEASQLLRTGDRFSGLRTPTRERFSMDILEQDTTADVALYASMLESGVWRFFVPAYWSVRSRLRKLLLPTYRPKDAHVFLADLRTAESCRGELTKLRSMGEAGRSLFGGHWKGAESDWQQLRAFADWVVELRRYAMQQVLSERALRIAASADLDRESVTRAIAALEHALARAREAISHLQDAGQLEPNSEVSGGPESRIGETARRLAQIEGALDQLRAYSMFVAARRVCDPTIARDFVAAALNTKLDADQMTDGFRRVFYEAWLDAALRARPALGHFHASAHEQRVSTFQDLDRSSLTMARDRVVATLHAGRKALMSPALQGQLQRLQREVRKRSRITPIRKLLAQNADAIQCIKPCFMMSPISVAQYLDSEAISFDLIVFDEASQIAPPDAIGAIIRAERVIVVGDSKQLPPTNFFDAQIDDAAEDDDSEEVQALDDLESILDEVAVAGVPSLRLKWHYRSEHQSLIRFSNEEFYSDDPLYVFPAAVKEADDLGLKLEHVDDGVYEGGGRNTIEARRVAAAVAEHARTSPNLSLGVGTFGIKQQQVILDEVDRLRREDPSIEWFFNQEGEKKFFVKNLENIQGDNRDVIFLSVTYGPDANGKLSRNFGPINQTGGWRRLNVLTTRAKRLMRVFTSMRGDQIDITNVAEGVVRLHQFLRYAETGVYPVSKISRGVPDSPFEKAVIRALEHRGYRVAPQVGDAGYRVDIGVIDEARPGRYICGIECDGATYHSAATVRDRDRLRQQVLEGRGWQIHRVWSTDWFQDPRAQIDRLVSLIEASRGREPHIRSSESQRSSAPVIADPIVEPPDERPALEDIDVEPYRFAQIPLRGTSESFYVTSPQALARTAREILQIESPMHTAELARRMAAGWGMQRIGTQIKDRVDRTVGYLVRQGELTKEGDFVWLNSGRSVVVRSRSLDGYTFSPDEIAPVEIVEAVRLLLRYRAPLLPDEIITETARLLGFGRTGGRLRERIEAARDRLVTSGELRAGSHGIHLAERS